MTTATSAAGSRKCQIVLLDSRHLDFAVQPRMLAGDLFDLVSSHFNLKEKEYFGLYFMDDTNHANWLTADRKVLEHDLPRSKDGSFQLFFAVRFYAESIAHIQDTITIELFYYQACQSIYQGTVECDSDTVFELAGHSLQAAVGDFSDDWYRQGSMRKLALIPTRTLREHPSIQYCQDRVAAVHRTLQGQTRGQSIVNYMSIVESLPTYGIHYYEVKDKSGIPWWLGLSYKGIAQYDHADKQTPRRVFPWKQLENLYFRDKKFSIEVQDPKRVVHALSSFNLYEEALQEPVEQYDDLSDAISHPTTQISVSRRTFGPSNVTVCAWFASKPQLTKCIWSMAVCQHQFYLDRRQSRSQLPPARSLSEIAATIPDRSDLLSAAAAAEQSGAADLSSGDLIRETIRNSLTSKDKAMTSHPSKVNVMSPEEQEARQKAYRALKARRDDLQTALHDKLLELRAICLKEASLIGSIPSDYPLGPGEKKPTVPRRVGTSFSIANKVDGAGDLGTADGMDAVASLIQQLELEYEIQRQITLAVRGLASDPKLSKAVRKKHKANYTEMHLKLNDIKSQLCKTRQACGLAPPDTVSISSGEHDLRSVHSSPASIRRGMPSPTARHVRKVPSTPQFEQMELSPGARRRNSASSSSRATLNSRRSVSPTFSTPLATRSRRLSGGASSVSQPNVNRYFADDSSDQAQRQQKQQYYPPSPHFEAGHFATVAGVRTSAPTARRRLDTPSAVRAAPLAAAEVPPADTLSVGGSSIGSGNSFGITVASAGGGADSSSVLLLSAADSCSSVDGGSCLQQPLVLAPPPAFGGGWSSPHPLMPSLSSSALSSSSSSAAVHLRGGGGSMQPPAAAATLQHSFGSLLSPHLLPADSSGSTSSLAQVHAYSVSSGRPLRSGSVNDVSGTAAASDDGGAAGEAGACDLALGFAAAAAPQQPSLLPFYHAGQHYSAHAGSLGGASGGASLRSRDLYANNPYGSLERKGARGARRSIRASLESPAPMPSTISSSGTVRGGDHVVSSHGGGSIAVPTGQPPRARQPRAQQQHAAFGIDVTGNWRSEQSATASCASSPGGSSSRSSVGSLEDRYSNPAAAATSRAPHAGQQHAQQLHHRYHERAAGPGAAACYPSSQDAGAGPYSGAVDAAGSTTTWRHAYATQQRPAAAAAAAQYRVAIAPQSVGREEEEEESASFAASDGTVGAASAAPADGGSWNYACGSSTSYGHVATTTRRHQLQKPRAVAENAELGGDATGDGVDENLGGSPSSGACAFSFDVRMHHSPSQPTGLSIGSATAAGRHRGVEAAPRCAANEPDEHRIVGGGVSAFVGVRRSNSDDAVVGSLTSVSVAPEQQQQHAAVKSPPPALRSPHHPPSSPCSPSHEESKPFEMSDYYKYSERLRQRRTEQLLQPPSVGSSSATFQALPSHPPFLRPRVPSPSGSSHDGGSAAGSRPSSPFAMFASFSPASPATAAAPASQQQPQPMQQRAGHWLTAPSGGGGSSSLNSGNCATVTRPRNPGNERPDAQLAAPQAVASGRLTPDRSWQNGYTGQRSYRDGLPSDGHGAASVPAADGTPSAWYQEGKDGRGSSATLV